MSEMTSEVPIGTRPAQGGRVKRYESGAERARAWRERRKTAREQEASPAEPPGPVPPELAVVTLGSVLDQLRGVAAERRRQDDAFAARIEEAVAAVTDPDAVASALDATRAAAQEVAAAAEARATAAEERRVQAEATAREAVARAEEAGAVADELDRRTEELEGAVAQLLAELDTERAGREADAQASAAAHDVELDQLRAQHAEAFHAQRAEHADALDRLRAELTAAHEEAIGRISAEHRRRHDEQLNELSEATRRIEAAEAARSRAERDAAAAGDDLARARTALDDLRAEQPGLLEAARAELRAALDTRHGAELDATVARFEGRIARLEGQLEASEARRGAAEQLLDAYRPA